MGAFKDTGWEWDFRWRRPLFDREIDMAVAFLKDVESHRIQPHISDQWVWKADTSGHYSAKTAYQTLRKDISQENDDGAFGELWKLKIPTKIAAFAWRLINDRLPTRTNLRKRHIEVTDSSCPFCSLVEETAGHIFFQCSKIIQLWWESLSWVNLVGVFPNHPRQHFLQHIHGVTRGMRVQRWNWWWLALTWTTWKHRNDIIFANGTFNANKLMDDAVFLLWSWLRNLEKDFNTHYNHWSTNLSAGFLRIP